MLMFISMLVAEIFTSALIFGPAYIIVLALCIALLIRFSYFKSLIGAAMVAIGFVETLLLPFWVFWVSLTGLSTAIAGIAVLGTALLPKKKRAWAGIVFAVLGFLAAIASLLGFSGLGFFVFALGAVAWAFSAVAIGSLLQEQRRVKTGLALTGCGFLMILIAFLTSYLPLAFWIGLLVVFAGISFVISGLPYWTVHSTGNKVRRLRKGLYILLLIVILSSSVVLSLRETRVLREESYDTWTFSTSADTTVQGIVTGVYLHHEVDNYGYSYHVFPALIVVNVTEVVKVGLSWMNLTEATKTWVNANMTVAYDRSDVPKVTVGQRVEASGYYNAPVEELDSYSNKMVIATEINGSYVKSIS